MARYWFKPKRYGYGVTPITWEGWVVSLAAGALVAVVMIVTLSLGRQWTTAALSGAILIGFILFGFVKLCRQRTDGEWRWRWGAEDQKR